MSDFNNTVMCHRSSGSSAGGVRTLVLRTWRALGAVGHLGFDIAVLWATLNAADYHPAMAPLLLGYIIGYLANILPVPGGVGVLESGLAGSLILYGAPAAPAAAGVLIYHAIAFWVPTSGGLPAYALLRKRMQRHLSLDPSTAAV